MGGKIVITDNEGSQAISGDVALTNEDLTPVPPEQRTWTAFNFSALWLGMVHNIFGFTVSGSMMATGFSALQSLTAVFLACLIQLYFLAWTGRIGSRFGIPFPVWARASFGVFGANIPALLRGITAIAWFGVQNYLGAKVLNALFSQVIPAWAALGEHVFAGMGLNLWISLLTFWAINFVVIHHGMETIRKFESWAGPLVIVVMIGLVIWALNVGGGLGPVFAMPSKFESSWAFVIFGLAPATALFMNAGFITMILNYPDLSRFAKSNRAQVIGTLVGLPIGTVLYYGMSAIIVSGTLAATGKILWDPGDVLMALDMPIVTVIGALMLMVATVSVNIPANLVSPAYDLVNLFPSRLRFKSAAIICIIIGFAYMPWVWMRNPEGIFSLLENMGTFLGPATGIVLADFIIRCRRLSVQDLYRKDGIYRFRAGFNPLAITVLVVATAVVLATKFIPAVSHLYVYSWFISTALSFGMYILGVMYLRASGSSLAKSYELAGTEGVEGEDYLASAHGSAVASRRASN